MVGETAASQSTYAMADFLLELYQDAAERTPSELRLRVLERLQKIVPFDFAVWGGGKAEGRLVTDLTVLDQSKSVLGDWENVASQDAFCDLTLDNLGATARFDDVPDYRQGLAYNEHWRKFDASHMMATIVAEKSDGYVSFVGLCADDRPYAFTESERLLKQILMPHFSQALRMNRNLWDARNHVEQEAIALVSANGLVQSAEGPFFELAEQEWGKRQMRLPYEVMKLLRQQEQWRGVKVNARIAPFGSNYFVQLTAVTALERLSPREREVAELFASGLTHKDVARELGSSPSTVRNQLTRAYEKLGISSKASLVSLLHRDRR